MKNHQSFKVSIKPQNITKTTKLHYKSQITNYKNTKYKNKNNKDLITNKKQKNEKFQYLNNQLKYKSI